VFSAPPLHQCWAGCRLACSGFVGFLHLREREVCRAIHLHQLTLDSSITTPLCCLVLVQSRTRKKQLSCSWSSLQVRILTVHCDQVVRPHLTNGHFRVMKHQFDLLILRFVLVVAWILPIEKEAARLLLSFSP
jgi:hypothetical protein